MSVLREFQGSSVLWHQNPEKELNSRSGHVTVTVTDVGRNRLKSTLQTISTRADEYNTAPPMRTNQYYGISERKKEKKMRLH